MGFRYLRYMGVSSKPTPNELANTLFQHLDSSEHSKRRIYDYYLPVFDWIHEIFTNRSEEESREALLVGINGQQGCGKSTLCHYMKMLFRTASINAIDISVDDFYLTRSQQTQLASEHPHNRYLQPRGCPGTHDVTFGTEHLSALKNLRAGESLRIPKYDKSAFNGLGDRMNTEKWPTVRGPLDVILFEGWTLGFSQIEDFDNQDVALTDINARVKNYEPWNHMLDAFILLNPNELEYFLKWRVEAEANRRLAGEDGLSPEAADAYARLFIPCYEAFLPRLRENPPITHPTLRVDLALDRLPVQS